MVKNIFKSISRPSANNCKKPHQKISILRKVMLVFITRPFKRPRGGYGLNLFCPGKCPVTCAISNFGKNGLVQAQNLLLVSNTIFPVSRVGLPGFL